VVVRFARGRGPFTATDVAARYGLATETAAEVLAALAARRALESGGFRPGGAGLEHCHPEVLRRIKQKSLAALRREVAAVDTAVLGRFLPAWHGIGSRRRGRPRLEEVLAQLEGLALPFAELESAILPARVAGFSPRMLDELGALGWLVWTGSGGAAAGKVSLYRRENAAALIEPPAPPEELGAVARAIRAELERAGASFFVGLSAAVPEASQSEVLEALWELVFAGLVTNDTFGPLRGRGLRKPSGRRGQARHLAQVAGGRWSLVSELCRGAPPPTERLHRRAVGWLERHGIVCRESATIEDLPGGFSTIYQVLGAMEEAGRIRRGYFVEGLGGAQFALAGAIDRLRAAASRPARDLALLAATDPANPFGWLAPWPPTPDPTGPRRAAGAWLILEGGEPIWFLDRGGRRLVSFAAATDRDRARAAAAAFLDIARRRRGRTLRIATLDGEPARSAPLAAALLERGFYADTNGLTLEVPR
jgi:ATP-dependent Lhr-like helicase